MSYESWLNLIKSAEKQSVIQGNVRKVHYRFPDGREMTEEYSTDTGVVLRRAWKHKASITRKENWIIELGDPLPPGLRETEFEMNESPTEPLLSKRLTRNSIEWRIRNLPFPMSTYEVTCDKDENTITIRTTNKKYFKKIEMTELLRCNVSPSQESLSVRHANATLIITYKKPPILLEMEKAVLVALQSVETMEYNDFPSEELMNRLKMQ